MTKEEAEKLGFNFSKNGPPRFKNQKKKDSEVHRSATDDPAGQDSNSRQVVEM